MKALTFHGKRDVRFEEVPDPGLRDRGDAIVRVRHCAICGSDLHVYHERETGLDAGCVLGHEFVGDVCETGPGVRDFAIGDLVVAPFTTACGECWFCAHGLSARCERGQLFGWVEKGEGLPGGQAEYVRVPLADTSLLKVPDGVDGRTALLVGDVLGTGLWCARGAEVAPGGVYVVVGCGPVGLMAIVAARELGAERVFALDRVPQRLDRAAAFGAIPLSADDSGHLDAVLDATEGHGADAILEAVGHGSATRAGFELVRAGGILSIVGVHTEPAFAVSPAEAYDKNLTIRSGRSPARSLMEAALEIVESGRHDLASVFTHVLPLSDGPRAYDLFDRKEDGCVKVALEP